MIEQTNFVRSYVFLLDHVNGLINNPGEYLFPEGSTYILGQKYWGSTFELGNMYWGSTFMREHFWGVTPDIQPSDR